jgi:hypothetical protein
LDSPLDSFIRLTDAAGRLVALNDDREDLGAGVNTHHADSQVMTRLPADGTFFVHVTDTARQGGPDYTYRLRLSLPRPDFALRVVPSSASVRGRSTTTVSVHALRKDGFAGPIRLTLMSPPRGLSASPVTLVATQAVARLTVRCDLPETGKPVDLVVVGTATIGDREIQHLAVPAEDRMQAFLWRHLVPAEDLKLLAYNPTNQPPPRRIAPTLPAPLRATNANPAVATSSYPGTNTTPSTPKPQFSPQQVATRLRQLKLLYEEGLLTDPFYLAKVAECEALK